MPESSQNSTGERSQSDILHSDYLPEYSLKPRYIITTIYPSSAESLSNERKPEPVNLVSSASIRPGNPGRLRTPDDGTGISFTHYGGQETETLRDSPESGGKQDSRSMELPRGRFRGVRRNARLTLLLQDLSDNCFTGYCRIIHDQSVMIIVLEKGTIILAGYGSLAGEGALATIYSCRNMLVDAQLNELDEPQLSLALEFNPQWRVKDRRIILPAGGEAEPMSGPQPDSICEQSAVLSQNLGASDAGMLIPDVKSREKNINELRKDSVLPIISADFEDTGVPPAIEGGKPETPDWKRALTMPFISTGDSSPSFKRGGGEENISRQKPIVSFEPLERDSALFESRPALNDRQFRYAPDVPEKWRLMSINRRENLSV